MLFYLILSYLIWQMQNTEWKTYLAKFPPSLTAIFPKCPPRPSGRQQKLMCLGLYFRFKYLKKPFNLVKQSSTSSLGAQRQLLPLGVGFVTKHRLATSHSVADEFLLGPVIICTLSSARTGCLLRVSLECYIFAQFWI